MKLKMILFAVMTFMVGSSMCLALGNIETVTKPPLFKEFLFIIIFVIWMIGNAAFIINLLEKK